MRVIDNLALLDDSFDGKVYSGNHIIPSVDGVDYPILHNLGVEKYSYSSAIGSNTGFTLTATNVTVDGLDTTNVITHQLIMDRGVSPAPTIEVVLTLSNVTGSPTIDYIYSGQVVSTYNGQVLVNGENVFIVPYADNRTQCSINLRQTIGAFSYDYVVSEKQVTVPVTSHLTAWYADTKVFEQLSTDGSVGAELVINGDFSDGANGWMLDPTFSVVSGTLVGDGSTTANSWTQSVSPTISTSKRYAFSFEILEFISGVGVKWDMGIGTVNRTTVGVYTDIGIPTLTIANLMYSPNTIATTDNLGVVEVLPISTTYNQTRPHNLTFQHTRALTANEEAELNANPDLIFDVWFNGATLVDGFAKADMGSFWSGVEGQGDYVQDLSVDLGAELFANIGTWVSYNVTMNGEVIEFANVTTDSWALKNNVTVDGRTYLMTTDTVVRNAHVNIGDTYSVTTGPILVDTTSKRTDIIIPTGGTNRILARTATFDGEVEIQSVKEVSAISIGTSTWSTNNNTGVQTLALKLDLSGRVLGTADANSIHVENDVGYVDTQWKPDLDKYTIEETVGSEIRTLTHDKEVYGPELITNGTFDSNIGNFGGDTTFPMDQLVWDNGMLRFGASAATQVFYYDVPLTLEVGKQYVFRLDTVKDSGIDNFDITLRDTKLGTASVTLTNTHTTGALRLVFTAVDASNILQFTCSDSLYGTIDNVSIKKVSEENNYYVDSVLTLPTPTLPDPLVTVKLNNTAVIGGDPITLERADFKVWTKVIIPII